MGLDICAGSLRINNLNNEASRKQVAYFRKFNAPAARAVRNVGEVENCELLELTMNDICLPPARLMQINESNCGRRLPTQEGLFFVSRQGNVGCWYDVGELKEIVEDLIKNHDFHNNKLVTCGHQ
ncbi:hypothetical protein QM042_02135 [Escherichia coli]|uniref:hypothetical protein n=1 Tax=Escherichia coli TaxID=562 RepID=UPI003986DFE3